MRWNDPIWVKWQIEHQKTGDPQAYNIWLMKKMNITIRVNFIPAMQALSRAMITTAEATRRLHAVLSAQPSLSDLQR
jgi:hypothetical protein